MTHIKLYVVIAVVLAFPLFSAAQGIIHQGSVHPIRPEDKLPLPEGDEFRFKGYQGEACPYHVKESTNTYVEAISREEEKDREIKYIVRLDIKNDSPCLFANIYLHMRLTTLEGELVRETSELINYIPSYSSNIVYAGVWLPIYVNPDELSFDFEYEQVRE